MMPRYRLSDDGQSILRIEEYWNSVDTCWDERHFHAFDFEPGTTAEAKARRVEELNTPGAEAGGNGG